MTLLNSILHILTVDVKLRLPVAAVADNKVEGPSFPYEKEYQAEPQPTLAQEPIQYNMAPQQQSYYSVSFLAIVDLTSLQLVS